MIIANNYGVSRRYEDLYYEDFALLDKLRGQRRDKTPERMGIELLHDMVRRQSYVWPSADNPALKLKDFAFGEHESRVREGHKGGITAVFGSYRNARRYSERYRKFENRVLHHACADLNMQPLEVLAAAVRMRAAIQRIS